MEQQAKTSFGLYELIRILVPGFYIAGMLIAFLNVFFPQMADWANSIAGPMMFMLLATLVAGVSVYARETPKRRRAFLENQPSTYLLNRSRTATGAHPLNDADAQRLYFYILNNHIPATFHEKIFFFGTVYAVMINIRRTSFWLGLACLLGLGMIVVQGDSLLEYPEALLLTLVVWGVYVVNVRYNKADRKMQENYQDQIFWLQMHDSLVCELLTRRAVDEKG